MATKSWKALPVPDAPNRLMKAPDWDTFTDQEDFKEAFRFSRPVRQDMLVAEAIAKAIHGVLALAGTPESELPAGFKHDIGQKFTVDRYPQGYAVKLPSGWTYYAPFEGKSHERRTPKAQGNVVGLGDARPSEAAIRKATAGND